MYEHEHEYEYEYERNDLLAARRQHAGRSLALVVVVHEPAHAGLAPPALPAIGSELALLARQIVVVTEVLAGQPAQIVDRELADRVFLVAEAVDQPLDAMALRGAVVPLAPLLARQPE